MATKQKPAAKQAAPKGKKVTAEMAAKTGILDSKQQSGLDHRHAAQRSNTERNNPAADSEAQSGADTLDMNEPRIGGLTAMGRQTPTTGTDNEPSIAKLLDRPGATGRSAAQKVGDTPSAKALAGVGKDHPAKIGSIGDLDEQLPVGTTIEFRGGAVTLSAPIAGGVVRVVSGATLEEAIEQYIKTLTEGVPKIETAEEAEDRAPKTKKK